MAVFSLLLFVGAAAAEAPQAPALQYHLAARPWQPLNTPRESLLNTIEAACAFMARHQDERGAIIDPFLEREHQYSTPYFAYGVATLLHADRGAELRDAGVKAMDHAATLLESGNRALPEQHGEFFIAPLAEALTLFENQAPEETIARWRGRLSTPLRFIIEGEALKINNWRTYAMKGEWLRAQSGLVPKTSAVAFVEDAWLRRTQRERIALDPQHLYQDWNGDPQSLAVEAVGRGNLLGLIDAGYDGPSAAGIRESAELGSMTALLLQDPTGQCPPNGRTDNHVFNDVLYFACFATMAQRKEASGEAELAQRFQRAALLSLHSIERWRRTDAPWDGSYSVTKNHFDPGERVGYQPASAYSNYGGAVIYHLSEAFNRWKVAVPELPAPSEIGGYAFALDDRFGCAVANAGGLQVVVNLRGDVLPKYRMLWTPLGVARISRAAWESRLGPSDAAKEIKFDTAVNFAPTWREGGQWMRLGDQATSHEGTFEPLFVHPLLVRCRILYHPLVDAGRPMVSLDLTITPDGVLATAECPQDLEFGMLLPLLENDGRPLQITVLENVASVRYAKAEAIEDEQHFIVAGQAAKLETAGPSVRSTYGWLRPIRATNGKKPLSIFVYPRSPGDPTAESVRDSLAISDRNFSTLLGRVEGTLYIGQYAAGGVGDSLDIDDDGTDEVTFSTSCGFIVQHAGGKIAAIETDRPVAATVAGATHELGPFTPLALTAP